MSKDLQYYKTNAEENYVTTPISVLLYIAELEVALRNYQHPSPSVTEPEEKLMVYGNRHSRLDPTEPEESWEGVCYICKRPTSGKYISLCDDHLA